MKVIGINKIVAISNPQRRTFSAPIWSIKWPIWEAESIVPSPGVAATIPAIKAILLLWGIKDFTYKETMGSIDIVDDWTIIVVTNIMMINLTLGKPCIISPIGFIFSRETGVKSSFTNNHVPRKVKNISPPVIKKGIL